MDFALSLPEIRKHISSFLSHHDLLSCALVSRAWFDSMNPRIWRSCTFNPTDSTEKLAAIHKNRSHTRTLHLARSQAPVEMYKWFTNLHTLHFQFDARDKNSLDPVCTIISLNVSSLRKIYNNIQSGGVEPELWIISRCSSLECLDYAYIHVRTSLMMERLLGICSQLTTLHLGTIYLSKSVRQMLHGQTFANIQRLKLYQYTNCFQLQILRSCPNLKTLYISPHPLIEDAPFIEAITQSCPQLCAVHLGRRIVQFGQTFRTLSPRLPPMKYLHPLLLQQPFIANNPEFPRHAEILQVLRLPPLEYTCSKEIETVLCSCSNLRAFAAGTLDTSEIEFAKPWVCQKIQYLSIPILVGITHQDLHPVLWGRLSELTGLVVLNIGPLCWDTFERFHGRPSRVLSPKLGQGLELVASLRKLERFGIGKAQVLWSAEDIQWMDQAWPNLEAIFCEFHQAGDLNVYDRLCRWLGKSRVRKSLPKLDPLFYVELNNK